MIPDISKEHIGLNTQNSHFFKIEYIKITTFFGRYVNKNNKNVNFSFLNLIELFKWRLASFG